MIQNPLISSNAAETNAEMVKIIRNAYEVVPEVRNYPEHSTSSTLEEAESVLKPETVSEKGHAAEYTIEYEAMVYRQAVEPAVNVLTDDKATAEEKEEAAEVITATVLSLMDMLEEVGRHEEDSAEAQVTQGKVDAQLPEAVPVTAPAGGIRNRRARSSGVYEFLGI